MRISLGEVDGNEWEELIHDALNLRYPKTYTRVPAKFGGDLGIESFNEKEVYQCYCPTGQPSSSDLYQAQRDKITKDIRKLRSKGAGLIKLMGNIEIETWYFVTPKYENKDLLKHCRNKEQEVLDAKLPHISNNFKIHVLEEKNFRVEFQQLNNSNLYVYSAELAEITKDMIEEWKGDSIPLFENIERKISNLGVDEEEVEKFIERNIRYLLKGQAILDDLGVNYPDIYNEVESLIDAWEDDIANRSVLNTEDPRVYLKKTYDEFYKELLELNNNKVDRKTSKLINNHAISYWLCTCPLNF